MAQGRGSTSRREIPNVGFVGLWGLPKTHLPAPFFSRHDACGASSATMGGAQMGVYEDNFGFWDIDGPEERAFFAHVQRRSVCINCERCERSVSLIPPKTLCATCVSALQCGAPASMNEYGYSQTMLLDPRRSPRRASPDETVPWVSAAAAAPADEDVLKIGAPAADAIPGHAPFRQSAPALGSVVLSYRPHAAVLTACVFGVAWLVGHILSLPPEPRSTSERPERRNRPVGAKYGRGRLRPKSGP